jgi:hypothetical protein
MFEPRTCYLPVSPALACIRFEHLNQAGSLRRHSSGIVISHSIEPEERR